MKQQGNAYLNQKTLTKSDGVEKDRVMNDISKEKLEKMHISMFFPYASFCLVHIK